MKEARVRSENIPPQHPICTLSLTLPDYRGQLPVLKRSAADSAVEPIAVRFAPALSTPIAAADLATQIDFVARKIGGDWMRLSRSLGVADADTRQIKREMAGKEALTSMRLWAFANRDEANGETRAAAQRRRLSSVSVRELHQALRRIGRDDLVHKLQRGELDSDSLRLIDSSNANLDHSSVSSRDEIRPLDVQRESRLFADGARGVESFD